MHPIHPWAKCWSPDNENPTGKAGQPVKDKKCVAVSPGAGNVPGTCHGRDCKRDFKHARVRTNDARITIAIVPGWLVGRGPEVGEEAGATVTLQIPYVTVITVTVTKRSALQTTTKRHHAGQQVEFCGRQEFRFPYFSPPPTTSATCSLLVS